jgi:transposase InsO family protein
MQRQQFLQDPIDDSTMNDEISLSDELYQSSIKESSYDSVDPAQIASACPHLSLQQQASLTKLLSRFPVLFNGHLRQFTDETIHLEVDPSIKPHRSRAYAVPHAHLPVFKQELQRLVDIGVLERSGRADWVSGTFIIPKKDGRVRWVSDFRALNKAIKRRYYPLPKIGDILSRRKGYRYLTKIDLSMQYYSFALDESSSALCTIATPFGLYRYKRLPMGVSAAPDIAQDKMEAVLIGNSDIEIYLDDIAIFSNNWEDHLRSISAVLTVLQDKGFTVNPLKCEWAIQETDFLGHWLTPTGVKPWRKKIDAILRLQPPTNIKQLLSFLGMVTYYRDMWPRRAHVLAPLTSLLKAHSFTWGPLQQQAFQEMRALMATDAILAFPDHNIPFDIETDASDYQLGAVIKQRGRPVAYYSRRLTPAQQNYTTIEKELLSVVETLRTFRTMLLGARLRVYTDHKNLTHKLSSFTTQRVMRWRLLLEEYGPQFFYKAGNENVIADALSRVPTMDESVTPAMPETRCVKVDDLWTECLWAMPKFDEHNRHPFRFETLRDHQAKDASVLQLPQSAPQEYRLQPFGSVSLVCKTTTDTPLIVLTDAMLPRLVRWYHEVTVHAEGMLRLEATMRRHFWHPRLRDEIRKQLSECAICKTMKKNQPREGQLAPRQVPTIPWTEVHVDTIGPWAYKVRGLKEVKVLALTMIDPVTNLVEIARVRSTKAAESSAAFESTWLARYPLPHKVLSDSGPEFAGHEWEFMLMNYGLRRARISTHTPTANAVIETTHRVMGQVLRTLLSQQPPPPTMEQLDRAVDEALSITMRACRCSANTSLQGVAPGALVFGRDMHLNIPLVADIITLSHKRQIQTDQRLLRENNKRTRHDYCVGHKVYVNNQFSSADKLKPVWTGPFPILQVHTNGTLTIRRGQVHERISIRRVKPA